MIVLDCSAAVEMAMKTEAGEAMRSLILEEEEVISSELFLVELASAFGKYVKAGLADKELATRYIQEASALPDRLIPISENYIEAFHESIRLKHSVYDLLYLTLARRNAATLVTLDTKLIQLSEEQGIDCFHRIA